MTASDRENFGKTVRRLRMERGWTQEKLGKRAKLHTTYVGGIERGERNIGLDNVFRLAKALREHPSSLFG